MSSKIITFLPAIAILASCGGTSNGDGSNNPQGSNSLIAEDVIGNEFAIENGIYTAEVNGVIFESYIYFLDPVTNQPHLTQNVQGTERRAHLGIVGEYVDGFAASYSTDDTDDTDFAFYSLDGTPSQSAQSGTVSYTGAYMTADASDRYNSTFIYEANLDVNYNSGVITGDTTVTQADDSNITFNGNVDGNKVELTIVDQYGTHEADGAVYGPDGNEIAAGYEDGTIAGLIYVTK